MRAGLAFLVFVWIACITCATTTTYDDSLVGTGLNQFNYVGSNWVNCGGCGGGIGYGGGFRYNPSSGSYVTFTFVGTQIKLRSVREPAGGIASVSIDGGAATMVDNYATTQIAATVYTSPVLSYGQHVLKVLVSGQHNSAQSPPSATICIDAVDVIVDSTSTSTPRPSTPTPKATLNPTTKPTSAPTSSANKVKTGNSGKSIENYGIKQQLVGYWLDRHSWTNIANAEWMCYTDSGIPQYKASHPDSGIDVGGPLIPHDMSGVNFNTELQNVISGLHDNDYRSYGKNLAQCSPKTVYLRLWWEFNLFSPIDATLFKGAWNRAVPLIRAGFGSVASAGQTLKIVWCPNSEGWSDISTAYPDGNNVDIIAADVYAWIYGSSSPTEQQVWNNMKTRQWGLDWLANFSKAKGKKAAIGEWANVARPSGVADSAYIVNQLYDWAAATGNVEYMMYFNLADGGVGMTLDNAPNTINTLKARA